MPNIQQVKINVAQYTPFPEDEQPHVVVAYIGCMWSSPKARYPATNKEHARQIKADLISRGWNIHYIGIDHYAKKVNRMAQRQKI